MKPAFITLLFALLMSLFSSLTFADEKTIEKPSDPFSFADFTWLNGNSRQSTSVLDSKYFTGEFSLDTNYIYDFNHPKDHTLDGSTNAGRTNELQVEQLGFGGDFHYDNVHGRFFTQFGMYSTMNPRNDSSPSRGQWDLSNAYRYISEAFGGYHWDVMNGINLDVGLFMSYVGLCSYYNFENWVYQMSYVSANTPWYFNGIRLQVFPTDRFKVELWLVNGWQSYGMFNDAPGIGTQLLWRPAGNLSFVTNIYYGHDTLGIPNRMRTHTDTSAQMKYLDHPENIISKAAFSLTFDAGCESGDGVQCLGSSAGHFAQNFLGFMAYNRLWLKHDLYGVTIGGGAISNPGRYLVLLPPINGATASTGSPFFSQNPGDQFHAWDGTLTFDYMPSQFITFRSEFNHRWASMPYFAASGGMSNGGAPDLIPTENRLNFAMMVRF